MTMNPLDELYAIAKERAEGRFKVITAAYVVEMLDMHRLRQNAINGVSSDSKR